MSENKMNTKTSHKQAFFFTIINYVGILIGIVSTLFIYPKNKELLGIFRYIESLAQIIFPVLLLGASQALINFHPKLDLHHKKQLFNYSELAKYKTYSLIKVFHIFTRVYNTRGNMRLIADEFQRNMVIAEFKRWLGANICSFKTVPLSGPN